MSRSNRPNRLSRRRFLQATGMALLATPTVEGQVLPPEKATEEFRPLNRFPRHLRRDNLIPKPPSRAPLPPIRHTPDPFAPATGCM